MNGLLTILLVCFALWLVGRMIGAIRRASAVRLLQGESVIRRQDRVPTRLFVSHALPGGIRPSQLNRGSAHLLLTDRRLVVGMWNGKVLDLPSGAGGRAACTGPRRLVIEASVPRRAQTVLIRLEMVVADAEGWASAIARHLAGSPEPEWRSPTPLPDAGGLGA